MKLPTVTSTAAAAAATTTVGRVFGHLVQFIRDSGVRLAHYLDEVLCLVRVLVSKIGDRSTLGTSATGSADAVNVIFDLAREIIIDDEFDSLHIQSARGNLKRKSIGINYFGTRKNNFR